MSGKRTAALMAAGMAALAWAAPVLAEDDVAPAPSHKGDFWERDALTGDWGGARSSLEDRGLQLGAAYIGEVLGNPAGGVRRGATYDGRLELFATLDLDKLAGWSGATFHANAYQIHGRGLSGNDLGGNLMTVSNIEATRSTRLFDLWLQQDFWEGTVSLRAGQIAADDEFFISAYGASFINATFQWASIFAADLPSGGPAYPLATPGARLKVSPTADLAFSAALFDGNPAGPGAADPQLRDAGGTSLRTSDDPFFIAEAAYATNQGKGAPGLPATYKLGGWYHAGRFADQRFDGAGRSLAGPASTGVPARRRGDFGLYGLLDQMVWREPGTADQGLGLFLRLIGAPADRNPVDLYGDGGINYKGLLPGRDGDVLGLALAVARIGDRARGLDADARFFSGANRPVRDYEAAIEVTYQAQLAPWWVVQPDLQYIIHPGGNVAKPNDPSGTRTIPNALVLGVRTTLSF